MELWFLRDPGRLEREIQAIRDLEDRAAWLDGAEWLLNEALAVDAAIVSHGYTYRVRLTYPAVFPFAPPAVRPIEVDVRWSGHQYRDGTLCLEWGPDTWRPEVTGAQVLERAR
jgi:ubiquitin-protein ligase